MIAVRRAKAELRKTKQEIADAEALLETKHAIKTYSVEDLGEGRSRGGAAAAKKRRLEVLDRMARLGTGLSPSQKNDFSWWKESWDAKQPEALSGAWPATWHGCKLCS